MDVKHWDSFYKEYNSLVLPTNFAVYCEQQFFLTSSCIVELGTGSGRDAIYFSELGHKVVALDQSSESEKLVNRLLQQRRRNNIKFVLCDFTKYKFEEIEKIDVIYSRFTLHSITNEQEEELLRNVASALGSGGMLMVETRTTNDELYGVGKCVGEHEYVTDHYRRFIDSEEFIGKLVLMGFCPVYVLESRNLSTYKGENPMLMRAILQKAF